MAKRYLEIAEADTNYEAFTELIRRVEAHFGYPNKSTKTQTLSLRRVNAGTPSSMLVFEEEHQDSLEGALTAGEIAAIVSSDPGGYSISALTNNSDTQQRNMYVPYNATRVVLCDGDSIMGFAGAPYTLSLTDRVYSQVATGLGSLSTDAVLNIALGGKRISQLVDDAAAKFHDINFPSDCQKILVVMAGTNDITHDAASAADTYADLLTYISDAKTAISGLEVIAATPIARIDDTEPTATLQDYQDLIIAGAAANGYTVADAGGLSMFDESGDTTNATYYQADEEHPTATGAGEIADVIVTAIEGL